MNRNILIISAIALAASAKVQADNLYSCPASNPLISPVTPAQARQAMSTLRQWSVARPRRVRGTPAGRTEFTNRLIVEGCARFQENGNQGVANLFARSIATGLPGLARIPDRSEDLRRFLAMIGPHATRPLTIRCVESFDGDAHGAMVARAVPCSDEGATDYPLIELNLQTWARADGIAGMRRRNPAELEANLFHEAIHLLGHLHSSDRDFAFLTEICFFNPEPFRTRACDLLARPLDWLSEDYIVRFAQAMDFSNESQLQAQTDAWSGAFENSSALQAGVALPAIPLFMSFFRSDRVVGSSTLPAAQVRSERLPLLALIFGFASVRAEGSPYVTIPADRVGEISAELRAFADRIYSGTGPDHAALAQRVALARSLGIAFHYLYNWDLSQFVDAWEHDVASPLRDACRNLLDEHEKDQLRWAFGLTRAYARALGTFSQQLFRNPNEPTIPIRIRGRLRVGRNDADFRHRLNPILEDLFRPCH